MRLTKWSWCATLGERGVDIPQPQRGCVLPAPAVCHNPVGVDDFSGRVPRVARASQPWAECLYPVGVNRHAALRLFSTGHGLATETQRLARHYQQKQAALAALKKSLLHQAFTGQL